MARDFNQNRNTNAHLGTVDEPIKKPGTFYAQSYGFDGLSYVKVDFPDFVKDFIQGNNDTFEYFVPSNITSIRPYAFSGFPNLNDVTILNETSEITINANAFNGTKIGNKEQGSKIWVVETYYDDYVSHYGSLYNFASFESETWYVVNYEKVGTSTLTKQLLNNLNIPLTFSGLVIASDINYVTSISVSELTSINQMWFKALNNLIFELSELPNGWVYDNGILYVSPIDYDTFIANHSGYENYIVNGRELVITGTGTLTIQDLDNALDNLTIEEVPFALINVVKISGYSDMSIALEYDYEDLPNLEYLWLDNVRFEKTTEINGYKICEYIESTGTQYINTGLNIPAVDSSYKRKMIMTTQFTKIDTDQANGTVHYSFGGGFGFGISNEKYIMFLAQSISNNIDGNADTNKHTFLVDRTNYPNYTFSIDGINQTLTSVWQNTGPGGYLYLFASSGMNGAWNYTYQKLYSCKLYNENNVLQRDFIPVYDKTLGTIGLYDLVNNQFYQNSGSGTFTKGNDYYIFASETYFYHISNLETEYNANLNQTFYLDYNGTLPSYPNYQLTYYTDINCTTSILPADLVSGTRYYVKAVMVTLVIQGSGTLTSAIVENAVNKAGNGVTKAIIDSNYTSGFMSLVYANIKSTLPNISALEYNNETVNFSDNGTFSTDSVFKIWVLSRFATTIPYNIGDEKSTIIDNTTYTLFVVDKLNNRYSCSDNTNYGNKLVIGLKECYITNYKFDNSNSNNYATSTTNLTTLPAIYNLLDSDLKKFITRVKIPYVANAMSSTTLEYVDNNLFLANNYELLGVKSWGTDVEETTRFDYYTTYSTNTDRQKKKPNDTNNSAWWIRSPQRGGDGHGELYITTAGNPDVYWANTSATISFFFAI